MRQLLQLLRRMSTSSGVKTTADLRVRAPAWTLADDVDLRRHLEGLAESIESQAKGLQQSLDQLEHKLLATQTSIGEMKMDVF